MEIKTDPVDIKYEIGDDIGRGKFATVKRCRDRNSGCEYAAKFIRKSRGTSRRGAKMENIEKEIQILSDTNHRNIINLYEVYDTKREVILILELVDGGELFEYLSEKDKLCEEEASSFVKQILEGVEHLHALDIAHLDLKPENILLQDKNSTAVKLIDFGLSRKILPKEDHRAIMGTAEFCAPEVISFEPLSVQTDMWSIGVITYVLLSGLSPFLGDNQQETYHNITSINFEFDEEYFNGTSDLAKDFIQKLLVKDTRKRATIHDCLNHPWIKPVEKRDKVLRRSSVINTEHLKKFIARQRWKRSMKVVSLCNRLSRSMQLRRIMSSDTIGSVSGTSEEDTDDGTDTEKGDRESTELDRSYKENVKTEFVQPKDIDIDNVGTIDSNKELEKCIDTDTVNISSDSSDIVNASKENAGIANSNKELTESDSVSKENTDNAKCHEEVVQIDDTNKESDDVDDSNKDLADMEIENEGNSVISNGNKTLSEIEVTGNENSGTVNDDINLTIIDYDHQEIKDFVGDSKDLLKIDRQSTDIPESSKESPEVYNADNETAENETADIGETREKVDNISCTVNNEHLADNDTTLDVFHNKSHIFNATSCDNKEQPENDLEDSGNLTTPSKNVVGEFDDDIGLLVSGTFDSNIVNYKSEEWSPRNVQKKRVSFSRIVVSTDVNDTAQHIVAHVIEASIGHILEESANGVNTSRRSVIHQEQTDESCIKALKEERRCKTHFRHYDPLRLVCFEVGDIENGYEPTDDDDDDDDIENDNNKVNIPKLYGKLANVEGETRERKKVANKGKLFKPLTTSKFDLYGQKHSGQRSFRGARKTRSELKVKKKANRFWEMEDCIETDKYEMFEMQVLNNSE